MSLAIDRQHIVCDGPRCFTTARLPVALRLVLGRADQESGVAGWLFVTLRGTQRHFCPACSAHFLRLSSIATPYDANLVEDETTA